MERGNLSEVAARIKDSLDIVEVIGGYISLTPKGKSHTAPCPFHQEKTPSFYVHSDRQFFHCFGCKKAGDLIHFVQEIENLTFMEALGPDVVAHACPSSQRQTHIVVGPCAE